MKRIIKLLTPPILWNAIKKLKKNKYGWSGDYPTWQDAQKDADGYDSAKILTKVKDSLLKVKSGKAVYERDSLIFDKIEYSWQLLSGLMFAAAKSGGKLKVLDFGGSLGSTYFQNRKFLDRFDEVSWSIVEQKHFVDIGKKEFSDDRLKFFYDIENCIDRESPNILLLSSVLQYIEKPYGLLDEILKYKFEYIVFDRTPFGKYGEKIKLQIVPPDIYDAKYPCWFFDEKKFIKYFKDMNFEIIEEFICAEGENNEYIFKGYTMERI